jgi:hypothetical protein
MNIRAEEKVWQREMKEWKEEGEDMIKRFSVKRMPLHFLSFPKKDKPLQGFRGRGAEPHTVLRKKKYAPFVVRIPVGR